MLVGNKIENNRVLHARRKIKKMYERYFDFFYLFLASRDLKILFHGRY